MNSQSSPTPRLWFYFQNDQPLGPISFEGLEAMRKSGAINDASLVVADGETEWRTLGEVLSISRGMHAAERPAQLRPTRRWLNKVAVVFLVACGLFVLCTKFFGPDKGQEEQMQTLEGRTAVLAKESHIGSDIEITPQVDDKKRIKITLRYSDSISQKSSKEATLLRISSFLHRTKEGGFEEVSSYWFNVVAPLTDKYGQTTTGTVGKLVIGKEAVERMKWDTPFMDKVERIFAEDGTLEWHPATD